MGFLTRLMAVAEEPGRGPLDDFWYGPVGMMAASGIRVTPENAMHFTPVLAGVRFLAETCAQIPLKVFQRLSDGGRLQASNHPLYEVLHDRPNRWQTSFEWREMGMGHLLLRGNFYNQIVPGPRGFVDQLVPLHPDKIKPVMGDDGVLRYEYRKDGGTPVRKFVQEEILHIRGMSSDGISGMSVVQMMREGIGLGMAAERYGSQMFSQGTSLSGVLQTDRVLDQETSDRIAKSWQSRHAGLGNAHSVAVLEDGLKWQQVGMSNEDAQFLMLRKFQVTEVARALRLPPHVLGDLERATFSNIEHLGLELVIYSLMPWFVRWEQRLGADLLIAPQAYFVEFIVDGLLRGDIKTRMQANQIGIRSGMLNPNETRAMENRNAYAGGEKFFRTADLVPMDSPFPVTQTTDTRARALALSAAMRVVRKETAALAKMLERTDAATAPDAIDGFYERHAEFVADVLGVPVGEAGEYTSRQAAAVKSGAMEDQEAWEQASVAALVHVALGVEVAA